MVKIVRYIVLLIGLLHMQVCSNKALGQDNALSEMAQIRISRIGDQLTPVWENVDTKTAIEYLQPDGSFSDGKPEMKHMTGRLVSMARDYYKGADKYKANADLKEDLYRSLQYWLDHRPVYKFPAMPFSTLRACAAIELVLYDDMMRDRLISDQWKQRIDSLQHSITRFSHWCWYNGKDPKVFDKHEGHNRGGNVGYRLWAMTTIAVCSDDPAEMDWVFKIVKDQFPRVVNTTSQLPTGFTPDGSWIQHNAGGAQNYWIGYGVHWINHALNYASSTHNTRWELSVKEYNTIADYFLDGIQWYHYRNRAALNLAGRHNALREVPMDKGAIHKFVSRLLKFKDVAFTRKDELVKLLKRNQDPQYSVVDSSKYFWNTDLLIHSRPNSYFAVKMLSNRTTGCETSESSRAHGKNNFFSGDGSTIIYRTGKEYDKARVGWNWRAVPGITAEQKNGALPLTPWGRESRSLNQFAGGLSNGDVGVAAFHYHRKSDYVNLKANKAYFTFENKMLALGNSICKIRKDEFDVWTTLNQTERKGAIAWRINGKKGHLKDGRDKTFTIKKIAQSSWVYHDGTGYIIIPQKKSVSLEVIAEKRLGDWADLDGRYDIPKYRDSNKQEVNIFQLSLNHGSEFDDADYAYWVVPGVKLSDMDELASEVSSLVLRNKNDVQSVCVDDKVLVVFHKKGVYNVNNNLTVRSQSPLIISLKSEANKIIVRASDPLHEQERVSVEITCNGKTVKEDIVFPQYPQTGASIEKIITF